MLQDDLWNKAMKNVNEKQELTHKSKTLCTTSFIQNKNIFPGSTECVRNSTWPVLSSLSEIPSALFHDPPTSRLSSPLSVTWNDFLLLVRGLSNQDVNLLSHR